jgi:hypothetical protein
MITRDENWIQNLLNQFKGKNGSSSVKWLKIPLKEGSRVSIRLLPINANTAMTHYQHWGITDRPITCMKTFGEPCPICDAIRAAEDIDWKKKGKLLPKDRLLLYVLKVNGNMVEDTPYIFSTTKVFMDEYMALMNEGIILDHPEEGKKIILIRKTDGGQLTRTIGQTISIVDILPSIEDKIVPLNKYIKPPAEEEIKEALEKLEQKFDYWRGKAGEEKQDSNIQINKVSQSGDVLDFYGYELTLPQKAKLITDVTGINIPSEYIACFGLGSDNNDKCEFCEYAYMCDNFKDLIVNEDKEVVDSWIKQAVIGG